MTRANTTLLVAALLRLVAAGAAADVLTVPAAGFHASQDGGTLPNAYFNLVTSYWTVDIDGVNAPLVAPLRLPDLAAITGVTVYAYDNDDDPTELKKVCVWLRRVDLLGEPEQSTFVASACTLNHSPALRVFELSLPPTTVDLFREAYFLSADLSRLNHRLYGVQIEFLPPSVFSDGFESGNTSAWTSSGP